MTTKCQACSYLTCSVIVLLLSLSLMGMAGVSLLEACTPDCKPADFVGILFTLVVGAVFFIVSLVMLWFSRTEIKKAWTPSVPTFVPGYAGQPLLFTTQYAA